MAVEFDDIKPWTWYVIEAGDYDLSAFTMLFVKKNSEDEWSVFDYGHDDEWVEKLPMIMNREEWDRYERGKLVTKIVAPEHSHWSNMAQSAIKHIFNPSTTFSAEDM